MFDISSLATIAAYVIMALGLYWMGKANGVKYPWLSWFPIASDYALGLIAEKGASRGTNESKPYRKILMGLSIAAAALGVLAASVGVVFVLGFVADLAWDWQAIMNSPDPGCLGGGVHVQHKHAACAGGCGPYTGRGQRRLFGVLFHLPVARIQPLRCEQR